MQTLIVAVLPSILTILGGILAFWKGWGAFNEKVNGVGERVNKLETDEATDKEAITELKQFRIRSLDVHAALQERLGKLEKSIEHTDDLINNMRIDIIQKINDLQRDITSQNGKVRERVVRLEVVTQIENKIGRDLNELLGSEE